MEMEHDDSDGSSHEEDDDGGGASGAWRSRSAPPNGAEGPAPESDSEGEAFDIGLAAAHSYLRAGMMTVRGRSVLEAGWQGRVPAMAHHGCVFPGETVPMLLPDPDDAALLAHAINKDRLFGLLFPDEAGNELSGYGVLCEVFEAGFTRRERGTAHVTFKARAVHRVRLVPRQPPPHLASFTRMRYVEVRVLPEISSCDTLRGACIDSLNQIRAPRFQVEGPESTWWRVLQARAVSVRARSLEAALTPWPLFVHDIFDVERMRYCVKRHFRTVMSGQASLDKMPQDAVSLSFWVASNMVLSGRDRLALFVVDHALLRLRMACRLIDQKSVLCCSSCFTEVAHKESVFPMSSEGVHSNYVNPGGYVHDLVTVRAAHNVATSGAPSAEFSWFPGYTWTVATCATCSSHVGWRFAAQSRSLRPAQFYGLCRNFVTPRPAVPARAASPP